jgi:Domain of unknown function (DUF4160)
MSTISIFFGILIRMYANEGIHALPHFHVQHGDEEASVSFDGTILGGRLSRRTARLVREWAALHQDELTANWNRGREGEAFHRIAPLS